MSKTRKEKKSFVAPFEIIPYEISLRNKTRRVVLNELFDSALYECEKNKIDLERINYIVFNQEYKTQQREKVFFIFKFDDDNEL